MLNAFFVNLDRIEELGPIGEYDLKLPASARVTWLLETLKNPTALSTMKVIEGPTDTSRASDGSSGEVTLRSQGGVVGQRFQDLTIHISYWHENPHGDDFSEPYGDIQIIDSNSGEHIENIGLKIDSTAKVIFDLVKNNRQQTNPAER